MAGLTTRSYGEGHMDTRNDQLTDHQGLVDRINAAAEKAQLAMDQADRSAADGGTQDLTALRAAVADMIAASHGFEALMKAGVTAPREGSAGGAPAGKDDKASSTAAPKQSASSSSPSSPGSSSTASKG